MLSPYLIALGHRKGLRLISLTKASIMLKAEHSKEKGWIHRCIFRLFPEPCAYGFEVWYH